MGVSKVEEPSRAEQRRIRVEKRAEHSRANYLRQVCFLGVAQETQVILYRM